MVYEDEERLVIIGGNTAGLSAALTVRRCGDNRPITILEKNSNIGVGSCSLPYKLGEDLQSLQELIKRDPHQFAHQYDVDLKTEAEVREVNPREKRVQFRQGEVNKYVDYSDLLVASGSRPFVPEQFAASERLYTATSVSELEKINKNLHQTRKAAVLGAGPIGVEFSFHLARLGLEVTLVEEYEILSPLSRSLASEVKEQLRRENVNLLENTVVKNVRGKPGDFVVDTAARSLRVDLAIGALGFQPNTGFIAAPELEKLPDGSIPVDKYMRSGLPAVYAAGDVVARSRPGGGSLRWPMASAAAVDGWTAGMNITGSRQARAAELRRMGFALGDKSYARIGSLNPGAGGECVEHEMEITFNGERRRLLVRLAADSSDEILGAEVIAGGNLAGLVLQPLAPQLLNRGKVAQLAQLEPIYHPGMNSLNSPLAVAARKILQ